MSFEEASSYLESLGIDAMKRMRPTMHRVEAMCEALDHPERAAPAIHVTGTNGKTSTARIATAILQATGLTVGTYTSPHLQTVRERIALNGRAIGRDDFGELWHHIRPYLEDVEKRLDEKLSYFEVLTAMFYLWAAEQPVDAMVVEVGLGGTWDATNVIDAPVAVITNVGLDHTGLLGSDRPTIAREKAGIIKKGSIAVTGERAPDVLEVIRERAESVGAMTSRIDQDFVVTANSPAVGGRYVSIKSRGGAFDELFLPLYGAHQGVNAATAVEAVTRFLPAKPLDQEVIAHGFAGAVVRGRLERVVMPEVEAPIVMDVAHNPDGASALVNSLSEAFVFESVVFVVGILGDKDYRGMLLELARLPGRVIVTQPRNVRSVPADDLKFAAGEAGLSCEVIDEVATAVEVATTTAKTNELVCITGSHYVVGEARDHLFGHKDV